MEIRCPSCGRADAQVKAGLAGNKQRYLCRTCRRRYTADRAERGYGESIRRRAFEMRSRGETLARIAAELGVSLRTISSWLASAEHAAKPPPSAPSENRRIAPDPSAERRRSTIHDVAKAARVSAATVSNYLNGKGRLGDEAKRRVADAIEALHFTPSGLMRAMRSRRSHILGLVTFGLSVGDTDLHIAPRILRGINHSAFMAQYDLLVYTGEEGGPRRHTPDDYLSGHIDGLIWVGPANPEPILERVAAAGLPVVALLTRHVPARVGYVNAENLTAVTALVDHLVKLGHRRIGYFGPTEQSNFQDRRDGYRAGLASNGIAFDPALEALWPANNGWNWAVNEPILSRLLDVPDRPTAIVSASDEIAARVIEAVLGRGLSVPGDISVTGFNDGAGADTLCGGLTTVRQFFTEMAGIAVERLVALIDHAPIEECRVSMKSELMIRATTAAPPVRR